MTNIKSALQRKFGPLPAWAWALIAGAGLYVYRTRKAIGTPTRAASLDATDPGITDNASARQDPVVLQPGESAYDPNTGQLVSTATEQQPGVGVDATVAPDLQPSASDEGTVWGTPAGGKAKIKPPQGSSSRTLTERVKRRKAKAKPQHKQTKAVTKPGHHKQRPRAVGKILKKTARVKNGLPGPKARARGKATAQPAGHPRARAAVRRTPAIRQRPAAPKVTHPGTQRVAPHPANAPTHADAPARHAPPKRHRKR